MQTRFLFWVQGAGELAIAQGLMDYAKTKGDTVLLMLDSATAKRGILSRQELQEYGAMVYDLGEPDINGRLSITLETYDVDVFVIIPSRTWQGQEFKCLVTNPKLKKVLKVGIENNLLFRGIGGSYALDHIEPTWLDYYIVNADKEYFEEAMKLFYGDAERPEDVQDKVIAKGWLTKAYDTKPKEDHIFVYVGGGMTSNKGYLQKILDALPKDQKVVAVSDDMVFGHYPNLELYQSLNNYDDALITAKGAIFHEGGASATKALLHKVPFICIRGKDKLKYLETEPFNILGYGKVIDNDQITKENVAWILEDHEVKSVEWGVPEIHNLIKETL